MADSILNGTDSVIDEWLALDGRWNGSPPRYKHKSTIQRLSDASERPENLNGGELVSRLLEKISDNWTNRQDKDRRPSSENWRFNKQPSFNPSSRSLEKTLEKSIVVVTENDWANQVPIASGLVSRGEGKRAIDLVHLKANNCFEFIELKTDEKSGGPLLAAMEILLYGLVYVFSRQHREELGYGPKAMLLGADSVELQVLAPAGYYEGYQLGWLENSLAKGLAQLSGSTEFGLSFKFRTFPKNFEWRLWSWELLGALGGIEDVTHNSDRAE